MGKLQLSNNDNPFESMEVFNLKMKLILLIKKCRMKTLPISIKLKCIVLFFLCFTCLIYTNAQTSYNISTSNGNSLVFYQYGFNSAAKISLGTGSFIPEAKFHIKADPSELPVFKVEGLNFQGLVGSVENCVFKSSQFFGIYQTGPDNGKNYFQNPVGICTGPTSIYSLNVGGQARIITGLTLGDNFQFDFPVVKFFASLDFIQIGLEKELEETTIMRLTGTSVIVNGKVKTNTFQMETGAGTAKVLVSDQYGNGTWGNVSSIYNDEDWYFNDNFDLYANPRSRKVGILTAHPSEALEVCHRDIIGGEAMGGLA